MSPFIGQFMITWGLTMKLLPAKCPEQATLWKLWRQRGNSSLLLAKCWPLLHIIRACSWSGLRLSLESQRIAFVVIIYQNGCFEPFVLLYNKLLYDWSLGNSEFCFPPISVFSLDFILPTINGPVFQGLNSRFGKYFNNSILYLSHQSKEIISHSFGIYFPSLAYTLSVCYFFNNYIIIMTLEWLCS